MTEFILMRHGEPDYSNSQRLGLRGHGHDLACLTQSAVKQIKAVSKEKCFKAAEILVVSPYTRTMQTAEIMNRELQLDLIVDIDLREWTPDLTYQYTQHETVMASLKSYRENNGVHPTGTTPIWEEKSSMRSRVLGCLEKYDGKYKCVLVVAHRQIIREITGHSLEFGEFIKFRLLT